MSSSDRSPEYSVVLVTAPSREQADTIAEALMAAKLAACVSMFPVHSIYTWQGKVEREDEWQLLIKTDLTKFAALEAIIRQTHAYEVPEIIALPILAGSLPYLQWISQQVTE